MALAVSLLTLAGAACSDKSTPQNTFEWKEEILLHDGRKIIAERVDVMGGWAEPGQSGAPQERRITFPDPDNPAKKYTHRITGSSNYLLLDFDKGVPWLIVFVGPFSTGTDCPIGSYETFTFANSDWISTKFSDVPFAIRKANMAVDYFSGDSEVRKPRKLLSSTDIQEVIRRTSQMPSVQASWKIVETNEHGRTMDCQSYPQLEKKAKPK